MLWELCDKVKAISNLKVLRAWFDVFERKIIGSDFGGTFMPAYLKSEACNYYNFQVIILQTLAIKVCLCIQVGSVALFRVIHKSTNRTFLTHIFYMQKLRKITNGFCLVETEYIIMSIKDCYLGEFSK